jgi:hypothetical protein
MIYVVNPFPVLDDIFIKMKKDFSGEVNCAIGEPASHNDRSSQKVTNQFLKM